MKKLLALLLAVAACNSDNTSPVQPETEPPAPAADADRVGLPADYATRFKPFYVFDRADTRQVRVVYANDTASLGTPFRHGSVLVMETYRARTNAQNAVVLDANGRYQRDALLGVFVMRKDKWFGRRYQELQTGDWEYASFTAQGARNVVGDAAGAGCAACHLDAGPARDWVFRANIPFKSASGAVPTAPANVAPDQMYIDNYTFVPNTITVKRGTRVAWTNRDQVRHTITTTPISFSGLLTQGATVGVTVNTVGTIDYVCAIHPQMRGRIIVEN